MADPRLLALQFFVQRGYTPVQAAGIVGNLVQESGQGLNTRAVHDGGTGLGVAGWRDPTPGQGRRTNLRQFAAGQGADVHDLTTQLAFVDHELKGPESRAGQALRTAQDPVAAARAFIGYERPAGWTAATPESGHGFQNRAKNAADLYAAYNGTGALPKAMPAAGGGPAVATPLTPSGSVDAKQLGDVVAVNPGVLAAQTALAQAPNPFQAIADRQKQEADESQNRRRALFSGSLSGLYGQ